METPSFQPLYPEDSAEIDDAIPEGPGRIWAAYGIATDTGSPPIGGSPADWVLYAQSVATAVRKAREVSWPDVQTAVEVATLGKSQEELDRETTLANFEIMSAAKAAGIDLSGIMRLPPSSSVNSSVPDLEASEAGSE